MRRWFHAAGGGGAGPANVSHQPEEPGDECVLRGHRVVVVVGQDLLQKLGLLAGDGLDHKLAVLCQVEDRAWEGVRVRVRVRVRVITLNCALPDPYPP